VQRYPELDLARGLAILLMVIYHAMFDLSEFYGWEIDVFSGGWRLMARATATLFLVLVGVGAAVSFDRSKGDAPRGRLYRCAMRFVKIGAAAVLISIVTFIANPETFVRFGILHLIAVSALILPLVSFLKERTAVLGIVLLALGPIIHAMRRDNPLLLPLGIRPFVFHSVDYFPMIPWFGIILIGYAVGYFAYIRNHHVETRHGSTALTTGSASLHAISWPGKHALLLYLIHQPIILAILWMLLGKPNI
jgi:uncharacterized membrane protein